MSDFAELTAESAFLVNAQRQEEEGGMSSQLKLSIDLNKGVSSTSENSQVIQKKDDQNDEKPSSIAANRELGFLNLT